MGWSYSKGESFKNLFVAGHKGLMILFSSLSYGFLTGGAGRFPIGAPTLRFTLNAWFMSAFALFA